MWGPAWIDICWNSMLLRDWSHMASHYTWGPVITLHDVGGVLGRPLEFGLSQFHGHGSWLVCEVALNGTSWRKAWESSMWHECGWRNFWINLNKRNVRLMARVRNVTTMMNGNKYRPLYTRAKSRDHEIVRSQKKSVQRPSQHTSNIMYSRTSLKQYRWDRGFNIELERLLN